MMRNHKGEPMKMSTGDKSPGYIKYELDESEQLKLIAAGGKVKNKRKTYHRGNDWGGGQLGDASVPIILGFSGEVAIHQICSVHAPDFPKPNLSPERSPRHIDFLYGGKKLEVKTIVSSPVMRIRDDRVFFDAVLLCKRPSLDDPVVTWLGWATAQQVRECEKKARYNSGDWTNYCMDLKDLMPPKTFLKWLKGKYDRQQQ